MADFRKILCLVFLIFYCVDAEDSAAKVDWEGDSTSSVIHLGDDTLTDFLNQNENVFIMFYAPWCGHCKRMKPAYIELAKQVNSGEENLGKVVAVDCTQNPKTQSAYGVRGYPTLKYFKNGKEFAPYKGQRTKEAMLEFMKNPSQPPTKAPEEDWSTQQNDVLHLTDQNFDKTIADTKLILVMFYAPWCGHCKKMKPEYAAAASILNKKTKDMRLAALDCTKYPAIRDKVGVKGYPTLKLYRDGDFNVDFNGKRTKEEFLKFMGYDEKATEEKPKQEDAVFPITNFDNYDDFKGFISEFETLVMFYTEQMSEFKTKQVHLQITALTFAQKKKNIRFGAVDCAKEGNKKLCEEYGYHNIEQPIYTYFDNGEHKPIDDEKVQTEGRGFFDYAMTLADKQEEREKQSREKAKQQQQQEKEHGGEL